MSKISTIVVDGNSYDVCDKKGRNIIADDYVTNKQYQEGDFVIYQKLLYKCLGNTSGSFNESKWEETKVVENLGGSGNSWMPSSEDLGPFIDRSLEGINFNVDEIGIYAFYSCASLTTISFPKCTTIGSGAFNRCTSLTTISFPECMTIGTYAFRSCTSLTTISFPECTTISNSAFNECTLLTMTSFPKCTAIGSNAFQSCTLLSQIYLANSQVCTLSNSGAFTNTKITSTTGSIYVPTSLVDTYKTATNWTYFKDRIFSIE